MSNTVNKIVDYINKNTSKKDKRIYMSLLYINKYILKDTVIKDYSLQGIDIDSNITSNEWLKIFNQPCIFELKSVKNINQFLDKKFELWDTLYGKNFTENKVKIHFDNIGLFEVLKDTKNTNNFINFIDKIEYTLDDIFEIFTQINSPDRNKNDFFTPMDMCNLISKIQVNSIVEQESIKVCDITCGIGNILYTTFKDIKKKFPNQKVLIFGNDLDSLYSSYCNSLFSLFNKNNSFFENKNVLTEYPLFGGEKMDIFVGNPPFGSVKQEDYEHMILHNVNDNQLNPKQLKYKKKLLEEVSLKKVS